MKRYFKRCYWFILFGIIFANNLFVISLAQEEIFENTTNRLMPPAIPQIEYSDLIEVIFLIVDTQNNNINDVHADIIIESKTSGEKLRTLQYIKGNRLFLQLHNGTYRISIGLNNITTQGFDYYSEKTITIISAKQEYFVFFPIGSIIGSVKYEDGSVAVNANVKFECGGKYGDISESSTDSYGSFNKDYVPIGNCIVYAKKDGKVDSKQIIVNQGEISYVELTISKNYSIFYIILTLFLIIVVGIIIFLFLKSSRKNSYIKLIKNQNQSKETDAIITNKNKEGSMGIQNVRKTTRVEDILKTLNEKERMVVEFLLKEDNAYQNKIVYSTGIAKTSLVRIIDILEKKNIINVEIVGNTKKIKLSDWFLEK
ncbi:MAG: hypothetical protein QXG00_01570 [Candidatus Woesearchaeota archaeon]